MREGRGDEDRHHACESGQPELRSGAARVGVSAISEPHSRRGGQRADFLHAPGQVFSREQILSRVWGYDYFGDTRTVDAHIKRIRQKLPAEGVKWALRTVYGVGYRFEVRS